MDRIEEEQRTRGMRAAGRAHQRSRRVRARVSRRATRWTRSRTSRKCSRACAAAARRWCFQRRHRLRHQRSVQQPRRHDHHGRDARHHCRGDARQRRRSTASTCAASAPGSTTRIEIQSFPDDPSLGLDSSALLNEVRLGQDSLRVLSDETGGFAVVNNNDFARRVPAPGRREQLVLRARLLPGQRSARRPVPQDRGARQPARAHGPRAPRLRRAARPRARRRSWPARTTRRRNCARR